LLEAVLGAEDTGKKELTSDWCGDRYRWRNHHRWTSLGAISHRPQCSPSPDFAEVTTRIQAFLRCDPTVFSPGDGHGLTSLGSSFQGALSRECGHSPPEPLEFTLQFLDPPVFGVVGRDPEGASSLQFLIFSLQRLALLSPVNHIVFLPRSVVIPVCHTGVQKKLQTRKLPA